MPSSSSTNPRGAWPGSARAAVSGLRCTDLPDWSALRGELDRSMVALEP